MIVEITKGRTRRKGFMTICKCDNCGTTFSRRYYEAKKKKHHFCSVSCFNKWNVGSNNVAYGRKYTKEEIAKYRAANNYTNNGNWRGGKTKHSKGYILEYCKGHPYSHNNYVLQHRLIMEKYLDRYLEPEEVVHHINSNIIDNKIENLMLFKDTGEHSSFHHKLRCGMVQR